MSKIIRAQRAKEKRGVIALQVAVLMSALLGVAALTIDVGAMYNARADLQRAADAAALAGVSAYVSDEMMEIRMGTNVTAALYDVTTAANDRVDAFSGPNPSFGTSATAVEPGDAVLGWINIASASDPIQPNPLPVDYNAVQVTVRRSNSGVNGPVNYFFARVLGHAEGEVTATATAAFDDRVGGFDISDGWLQPFTVNENVYQQDFLTGGDQFSYDANSDTVSGGADGIREINLYPGNLAPGNFGLLNIGTPNMGVPALKDHIENGVPPGDLAAEIGTTELSFVDGGGSPTNYTITGNPGLKAALESSINLRVGDVIGFLLHDQVTGSGANADYRITTVRFGRVMGVQLNGPPAGKGLWIQPVIYTGGGLRIQPNAPPSGGMIGRIVLAR